VYDQFRSTSRTRRRWWTATAHSRSTDSVALLPRPGTRCCGPRRNPLRRVFNTPLLMGPLAAAALLGLYLGLITLAQGSDHALEQFDIDLWFVLALSAGFGSQVGLFTYLRALHARMAAGGVGMATSTGTSTAAMLACCAHHLSDVLPILGISGAAVFLGAYKTPLLWVGLAMNLAGIAYLLRQIHGIRATPGVSRGFHAERTPPGVGRSIRI
jgi:hypothetical protein